MVWDATIAVNPNSFEFNDFVCAALVLSLGETILENDDAQTILYELQNFTQGFNIDIIKLLELAREIKTRLTGKLMDSMMDEDDVAADEEENNKTKEQYHNERESCKASTKKERQRQSASVS